MDFVLGLLFLCEETERGKPLMLAFPEKFKVNTRDIRALERILSVFQQH